jgi:hypothetical protein
MSERQAPEMQQPELVTPNETSIKPKKKNSAQGFDIVRFEKRVTATFSIMGKLFVIALIGIAVIFISRQLTDSGYSIKQVNMPVDFQDAGYTGPVVANRILSHLREIIDKVKLNPRLEYVNPNSDADVSVDLVGVGVPVRGVINLLGEALGIDRGKSITTDMTVDGDTLLLRMHISGEVPEQFRFQMNGSKEMAINKAVAKAAHTILKYTSPDIISLYNSSFMRDVDLGIALSKFTLERYKGDPYYEAGAYAQWAIMLLYQGKLEKAEEKLMEGLAKHPHSSSLNTHRAVILSEKGDIKGALAADKKALYSAIKENYPEVRLATPYSNIGYDFTLLGESDSAIYYYQKAIESDANFGMAYYNIGINYLLLKHDTAQFLENFETALARNMPRKGLLEDPDIQGVLPDPRVQALLKKYESQ